MEPLFSTLFPAADKTAWLAQVQKELKSEGAYEGLRWHTGEGFIQEPYYTADDLASLPIESVQAAQKQVPGWLNTPERSLRDEQTDNAALRHTLAHGADALVINLLAQPDQTAGLLSRLLNGIKLSDTPIFFQIPPAGADRFVQALKTVAPYQLKGGLLTEVSDATAEVTHLTADSPQFRTVCVSSHAFHNAGATATQELAFTMGLLADGYEQLTTAGLTLKEIIPKTILSVSVGTSYFLEVAKLRALRVLYNRFLSAYSTSYLLPPASYLLHAQTSTFYDSRATPYTNLLRATTEAMGAVIGGCDLLTVHPYNAVLQESTGVRDYDFSDRIAQNVSVLLKEESYLDKVADPSAGSYYIENLTHQLVETAWTLFLNVEQQGGLTKALAAGFIQTEIERAYQAKLEAVRNGKVLVGVTKFRFDEENETIKSTTSEHQKDNAGLTELLPDRRLADVFE